MGVAGLIGNPIGFIGRTSTDANILSNGIYRFYVGSSANALHYPCEYGHIIVANGTDACGVQIASNSSKDSPEFFMRLYWEGWSEWKKL